MARAWCRPRGEGVHQTSCTDRCVVPGQFARRGGGGSFPRWSAQFPVPYFDYEPFYELIRHHKLLIIGMLVEKTLDKSFPQPRLPGSPCLWGSVPESQLQDLCSLQFAEGSDDQLDFPVEGACSIDGQIRVLRRWANVELSCGAHGGFVLSLD